MNEVLQYQLSIDANGNPLDGSNVYRFNLTADFPACKFWSVILYDTHDQQIIRTDQSWPSVHSQRSHLLVNENSSVDAYFGPKVLPGKENNWVKTIPGKGWFMILRLYDPHENPVNSSWKPGEIVLLE